MNNSITVETRSGCQYIVYRDVIDAATDGFVYGYRTNGTKGGPFHRSTQNTLRWFFLKNVKVISE